MVMIHRHAMQKIKVKVRQFKTYGHDRFYYFPCERAG